MHQPVALGCDEFPLQMAVYGNLIFIFVYEDTN